MSWIVIDVAASTTAAGRAVGPFEELIDVEHWACLQTHKTGQPVLVCELAEPTYTPPKTWRPLLDYGAATKETA